jgi:uncharacterized protein YecE (DUF72 family)
MRFFVGTSGFSYKPWRGSFYPKELPEKEMLGFYAQRLSAVEINNTFYRMPTPAALAPWTRQVPVGFRFVLKAPQKITHIKRLKGVEDETAAFQSAASALKRRKGPLLFQLPPNFKKDVPRLSTFLNLLGDATRAAFEFRHASWLDDEVFDCLRSHACSLCVADGEDLPEAELVSTAHWGYVRLRRENYDDRSLRKWITRLKQQDWSEAWVFFKHEDTGIGPKMAVRFVELAGT